MRVDHEPFRIAFVPGVMPDKWLSRWRERMPGSPLAAFPVALDEQRSVLDDARADMCFVRLPVARDGLHVIPLYVEQVVVAMASEHVLSLLEEVTADDLAGELVNEGPDRIAIETAAAGTGVAVVPRSVARLHHRKDLTTRPLAGAEGSQIGLAWRVDLADERTETFVGIVRGRTSRSSRDLPDPPSSPPRPARPGPDRPSPRRGRPTSRKPRRRSR